MRKPKKVGKKIPKKIIREKTLTSEYELIKTRKEINARNKERSRRHENRVATYLSGRRVPNSGSAKQYKGDVEIRLRNTPGVYLIECKTSALIDKHSNTSAIRMQFDWLDKIMLEAKAMDALFGVLIIHYYNQNFANDYVLIRESDVNLIINRFPSLLTPVLQKLVDTAPIIELRYNKKDSSTRRAIVLIQKAVETAMIEIDGMKGVKCMTPHGIYLTIYLQHFRELMAGA